ncbi:MAG: chemotaxis protein methyltransferase CheR [Clostridia bacterium]|nr:methyltransferase, CheR-type [Clostridiales bacterium]MDK2985155.1 chemotaxis protein methyltransferase CheR [Clostridia bacterium]
MDFNDFRQAVSKKLNIDLQGYKERQLKRRIDHLMKSQGFDAYEDYYRVLAKDNKQKDVFLDKLTINVSEFFRNKNVFETLENKILPTLLSRKKKLKIWSAACSNGAEPYSVAIILHELTPGVTHTIDATDIDEKMLYAAREGSYRKELLKNVSQERLEKYFQKDNELWSVIPEIKRKVNFKKHDLLRDEYPNGYDLIICRNVTIYFTKETQNRLYRKFWSSLVADGILFIGATESILNYRELRFTKISPWFYQKVALN